MSRRSAALVAVFGALVIASRIPFAAHQLWAWDSVLYARALEDGFHVDFDLSEQRPQPPGYILYLAFASVFRAAGSDANGALVLVSIVASGVGAVALYLLARRFTRPGPAALAAAGFAFNPLVWMYSELAYPYVLLGALSVSLAAAFWHARLAGGRGLFLASAAFGLVAGFRQDLLLLLGPLWLWAAWPGPWRVRSVAAAWVAAGIVVWFIPTALLSGGLVGYLDSLSHQGAQVNSTYSVLAQGLGALSYNLRFTVYALAWGLLGFGVLLLAAGVRGAREWLRRARPPRLDGRRGFFAAWLVPGLAFYVAVHIGEWGYVLSVLPGLYVLVAAVMDNIALQLRGASANGWRTLGAAAVLVPAVLFTATPQRFSAAAVHQHDVALDARVAYMRANFAAERTIIIAREDFLLVRYYLPEYRAWLYDPEPHGGEAMRKRRAMKTTSIVIFTAGLTPRQNLDVRYVEVSPGIHLAYVAIEPGSVLEFYGDRYTVREPE